MTYFEELHRALALLRVVADEHRLRIITVLVNGPMHVGDLAAAAKMEMAQTSHHLGVLRKANIAVAKRKGRFIEYALHPDVHVARTDETEHSLNFEHCRLILPAVDPAEFAALQKPALDVDRITTIVDECVNRSLGAKNPLDAVALALEAAATDHRLTRVEFNEIRRRAIRRIVNTRVDD